MILILFYYIIIIIIYFIEEKAVSYITHMYLRYGYASADLNRRVKDGEISGSPSIGSRIYGASPDHHPSQSHPLAMYTKFVPWFIMSELVHVRWVGARPIAMSCLVYLL